MNKDLIETPRFNFFIGDEVFLKGKIVGFDVDENKCVENVVRLGYGETLNVPNNDIYITDESIEWLANAENQEIFARAWLDDYDIQKTKYVVTDGNHLYFKNYQEDIEIVILVDEQPGTMDYVKKFDTREGAQKAADILGWKVQEVKDET